tara:strand:- start:697 stop:2397 length:1701 start_codon:yes stop_codon:yes gene_type:complete
VLQSLQVKNFAIIDEVDINFDEAMTALTGETGAGKSILVDALSLVLGERGGNGLVRQGCDRAHFTAEFNLSRHQIARNWLMEKTLDDGDDCVLRRVISSDGRSRAFINGNTVTLQTLKSLGEILIDIHGQHFHQSLGKKKTQRELLDYFGNLLELQSLTHNAFEAWKNIERKIEKLSGSDTDRETHIDLLTFQINELESLNIQPGELSLLEAENEKLKNSGKLFEGINQVIQDIQDRESDNAQNIIINCCKILESLSSYDKTLTPAKQLLEESIIETSEAIQLLRRYEHSLENEPDRQKMVEDRLNAIKDIARKHKTEADQLFGLKSQIEKKLEDLKSTEEKRKQLIKESDTARDKYFVLAGKLSKNRNTEAKKFSDSVTEVMQNLGMPEGKFRVNINKRDDEDARSYGIDNIEYLISANPGQQPMPLAKIASGGELSRMSLAIQVIASNGSLIPTMIFDEVDSGVGGSIAEMVGRKLYELGLQRQVLCVTHLPQVASQANNHFRINKITDGKSTYIRVAKLDQNKRIEELARMLGGVEITKKTMDHAAEMLANKDVKKIPKKAIN